MQHTDLIKRLLDAPEGTRDLSNAIAVAFGWERNDTRSFVWRSPKGEAHHTPPDYSRDVTALLAAMPPGLHFSVSDRAPAPHKGRAYLHNDEMQFEGGNIAGALNPRYRGWELTAHTPALALAACLVAVVNAEESAHDR